jgi:hypothetical protein
LRFAIEEAAPVSLRGARLHVRGEDIRTHRHARALSQPSLSAITQE